MSTTPSEHYALYSENFFGNNGTMQVAAWINYRVGQSSCTQVIIDVLQKGDARLCKVLTLATDGPRLLSQLQRSASNWQVTMEGCVRNAAIAKGKLQLRRLAIDPAAAYPPFLEVLAWPRLDAPPQHFWISTEALFASRDPRVIYRIMTNFCRTFAGDNAVSELRAFRSWPPSEPIDLMPRAIKIVNKPATIAKEDVPCIIYMKDVIKNDPKVQDLANDFFDFWTGNAQLYRSVFKHIRTNDEHENLFEVWPSIIWKTKDYPSQVLQKELHQESEYNEMKYKWDGSCTRPGCTKGSHKWTIQHGRVMHLVLGQFDADNGREWQHLWENRYVLSHISHIKDDCNPSNYYFEPQSLNGKREGCVKEDRKRVERREPTESQCTKYAYNPCQHDKRRRFNGRYQEILKEMASRVRRGEPPGRVQVLHESLQQISPMSTFTIARELHQHRAVMQCEMKLATAKMIADEQTDASVGTMDINRISQRLAGVRLGPSREVRNLEEQNRRWGTPVLTSRLRPRNGTA